MKFIYLNITILIVSTLITLKEYNFDIKNTEGSWYYFVLDWFGLLILFLLLGNLLLLMYKKMSK